MFLMLVATIRRDYEGAAELCRELRRVGDRSTFSEGVDTIDLQEVSALLTSALADGHERARAAAESRATVAQRVTVSAIVTVLVTALAPDPDVALTTTGNVPAGVPPDGGGFVPPSPPHEPSTRSTANPARTGRAHGIRALLDPTSSRTTSSSTPAPTVANASVLSDGTEKTLVPCDGDVVAMVSVVETAAALGVNDAGAKLQLDALGSPEQLNETA